VLNGLGEVLFVGANSVSRNSRGAARLYESFEWYRSTLHPLLCSGASVRRAAIEGPSLNSTHREFDLGEASAVAKLAIYHCSGVEPIVVPPTQLKRFATGSGSADKEAILHAVKTHLGVMLGDDDDAADALMLARFAWALDHQSSLTRRCELETVRAVLEPRKKKQRVRPSKQPNL
jgi:Holliday junction resolvasome RuvABC endonuclease subunit